jgi:hypothetical protein
MRIATRVALLSVVVGVSAVACAERVPPATSAHVEVPTAASGGDGGVVDAAGDAVAAMDAAAFVSLDALAARAPSLAAGMREVARGEIAGEATRVIARAEDRDVCVRVTMVARYPVHASLIDARGEILADVKDAFDATLGAHGPVCTRKGDAVSLRVDAGAMSVVRFVAWQSP